MLSSQFDIEFDLADLVAELISLQSPNRAVDQAVDIMIGGSSIRERINTFSARSNKWLFSETPYYTRDIKPVEGLAMKNGVILHIDQQDSRFFTAVAIHATTGQKRTASAPIDTCAALAAMVCLNYGVLR